MSQLPKKRGSNRSSRFNVERRTLNVERFLYDAVSLELSDVRLRVA
jgi:hypothetical protein